LGNVYFFRGDDTNFSNFLVQVDSDRRRDFDQEKEDGRMKKNGYDQADSS
jgi:hypothetical protein